MALHIPKQGLSDMMKGGVKHFKGTEEAIYRNVEISNILSDSMKSAFGPYGRNKIIINHLGKMFLTSDVGSMLNEMEVENPIAKLLVMASKQQEQECGDGTNSVIIFSGTLLRNCADLVKSGLSIKDVCKGLEISLERSKLILSNIPGMVIESVFDKSIMNVVKSAIISKNVANCTLFTNLVVSACRDIYNDNNVNTDHVRVVKLLGNTLSASTLVRGLAVKGECLSKINKISDKNIAVFSCPLDLLKTETKGTVLFESSKELMDYSKGEEDMVEKRMKAIYDAGVECLVVGGKVGDLALQYADSLGMMVVRVSSKWDIRRIAYITGATPIPKIAIPTPQEFGSVKKAYTSSQNLIVFDQLESSTNMTTIAVHGSTMAAIDDAERAIDDGVNTFKILTRNGKVVPGAGSTEIEMAMKLRESICKEDGVYQYVIEKFAESLEIFPVTLAENSGGNGVTMLENLYVEHANGNKKAGVILKDCEETEAWDSSLSKHWMLHFATQCVLSILRVDEIIMAKRAGGPKPKTNPNWDED
ncbi:CCT-theta [Intoshia linei]|uniref:T-complex protein 1 subunit theta n=1 Tax=Intoshia linei TaxID=1819745 RepID=A0A177BC04_9BILA|nr:CCT-theta [Intoshia linei]